VDDFIETPVKVMQPVAEGEAEPPVWQEYRRVIARHESRPLALTLVERFEFYDLARSAFAVVATTETAIYGNIIVKKGVVRSPA
jgi:L-fucose mutarotase